ncbi:hypothetical protein V1460_19720 [Streptomyces sp. SCSIO 30461]|uniref:hypothetical protein n=1 Tax=Streptomyces sp. SCSIO 30461 TaxID=3118085 RepID=UPI0030D2A4AD
MRKITHAFAALATAAAAVMAFTGPADAKAADWAGCPDGAVCIYPQNQNPAVRPTHIFWSYGSHNLSNQFGNHWVLNNQTGGATAALCTGYNGAGCGGRIAADHGVYADLTPINSVTLYRP